MLQSRLARWQAFLYPQLFSNVNRKSSNGNHKVKGAFAGDRANR